jgi:hypothetical protein
MPAGFRIVLAVAGIGLLAWGAAHYLPALVAPPAAAPAAPAAAPAPPATVPPRGPASQASVSSANLIGAASDELAACPVSTAPAVPDGATASLAQMTAARAAFEAYDAATNAYVKCVDSTVARISARSRNAAPTSELQSLDTFGRTAHNTAIDQEQAVADQFNREVRAYKAKHSRP